MKLKVWSKKPAGREEVLLRLKEDGNGGVTVEAVHESGERFSCGNLLAFEKDGTLYFYPSVNEDLGFDLNDDGELKH